MARRKKLMKLILGVLIGVVFSQFFTTSQLTQHDMCFHKLTPQDLIVQENVRASNKSLLFVGVMTAARYLDTRAKAVYDTWGREVPGKVMFFSSEYSYSEHVPLVALPDVDDSYPPQKKSFMMLKHMYDNYIDKYEWFLRADDDVYIRTDRLEKLLRSVDSRKPWFIGQTGRGNSEEFGLLSLENDENFCMGGPGVILSRETLRRMAPYVEECLEHLYTTHEDVELGRCVRKFAGISCTWSYEMQVILYHNNSGQQAFTGDLKQKEVHRAITMHPVKQPEYMYRLHKYVKGLKIQSDQQNSLLLHRDIGASMLELGYRRDRLGHAMLTKNLKLFPDERGSDAYLGDTNVLGTPTSLNRYPYHSLENVLEWELISKSLYSHRDLNPRKRIGSSLKEGLSDVVREIMDLINSFSKQRGRVIDFKEILYGYWRLDPVHGVDLILDLLLVYRKYRGHKMTVHVRRHAYVQQTFTGLFIKEIEQYHQPLVSLKTKTTESLPVHKAIVHKIFSKITDNLNPLFNFSLNNDKKEVINFILPISGRYETFKRFVKNYEDHCLKREESTKLYIILYEDTNYKGDLDKTKRLIDDLIEQYGSNKINVVLVNEPFARAKALHYGVNRLQNEDLMLFIDVDIIFDTNSLERIRKNTVINKSVYFPIVYSLYNSKLLNKSYVLEDYTAFTSDIIDSNNGFWRQFGFGIVSIHKSDYLRLGGFNLMISGWGFEDVFFFDNAIKSNIKIVRSVDPSLIHVFHFVNCGTNLDNEQRNMCIGTKASTLGSLHKLQELFMKHKHLFR